MAMASYSCKESRSGELDLEREKDLSAEGEREKVPRSTATFTMLPVIYSGSGAQQWQERQGFMAERSWGERERVERVRMVGRRGFQRGFQAL
jgi:hypothetical protein